MGVVSPNLEGGLLGNSEGVDFCVGGLKIQMGVVYLNLEGGLDSSEGVDFKVGGGVLEYAEDVC